MNQFPPERRRPDRLLSRVGAALAVLSLGATGAVTIGAGVASAAPTPTATVLTACKYNSAASCPPLTSPSSIINFGQTVQLTATVSPIPTPGTKVVFTDVGNPAVYGTGTNSTVLGTENIPSGRSYAIYLGTLPYFGLNTITAVYQGNASFGSSTSNAFSLTVNVNLPNRYGTLIIGELRPWGPAGINDNYLEIYDNSIAATNEAIPLSGWKVEDNAGDIYTFPPGSPTLQGKQSYLLTGSAYSLALTAHGDQSSVHLGSDVNGDFGFQLVAPDGAQTSTDQVCTSGATALFCATQVGLGNALPPLKPPTPNQPAQWAWTRLSVAGLPQTTGENLTDFLLVSNSSAAVGAPGASQVPALGAPAPQSLTSPYQQNQNLHSDVLVPPATTQQALFPNRIYVSPSGSTPGSLIVQRTITNDSNYPICGIQVHVTSQSQAQGGPQPNVNKQPTKIAQLRMTDPSYVGHGLTTAPAGPGSINPTAAPILNLSPDLPANGAVPPGGTTGGAGQNTLLTVPTGVVSNYPASGLPSHASINVSFTFAVDTNGEFWYGYNVNAFTPLTGCA